MLYCEALVECISYVGILALMSAANRIWAPPVVCCSPLWAFTQLRSFRPTWVSFCRALNSTGMLDCQHDTTVICCGRPEGLAGLCYMLQPQNAFRYTLGQPVL